MEEKMFIVSPRIGLCNQLQTIVKGILLGIKYNRNIYIDNFQIDLSSGRTCNIEQILDIPKINIFLQSKTQIRILNNIDKNIINNLNNYVLPNVDYNSIPNMSYINDCIDLNEHMNIIYLGNIVSLNVKQSFDYDYNDYSDNNLYYLIMINLSFNEIFYKMKDHLKTELKLTNYNCIHLRIEDDALEHFAHCYKLSVNDYNKKLLNFYDEQIKICNKNKTYVSSGMLQFHNKTNFNYYNNLIKNTTCCDKRNITLDKHYLNNRELIAIVDLLIAYDSDYFVGCWISSFSQLISNYFKYNKKQSVLFRI